MGKSGVMYFSVHGNFVTRQAREFLLEGSHDQAMGFLHDSFTDFPLEYSKKILMGLGELQGINDLEFVEKEDLVYIKKLEWFLAGIYKERQTYYQPYAFVNSWCGADLFDSSEAKDDYDSLAERRSTYYLENPATDIVKTLKETYLHGGEIMMDIILLKKIEMPFWLRRFKTIYEDFDMAFEHYMKLRGDIRRLGYIPDPEDIERAKAGEAAAQMQRQAMLAVESMKKDWEEPTPEEVKANAEGLVHSRLCTDYELDHGWLSPKGKFYRCMFGGHRALSEGLVDFFYTGQDHFHGCESQLEDKNWIKLSTYSADMQFFFANQGEKRHTPKQEKAITEWCLLHKKTLPGFIRRGE